MKYREEFEKSFKNEVENSATSTFEVFGPNNFGEPADDYTHDSVHYAYRGFAAGYEAALKKGQNDEHHQG